MSFRTVLLKGDYTGQHERQAMAQKEGCAGVVDFHFNSFDNPQAHGGEVFYKSACADSKKFARSIWSEFEKLPLPPHGDPLKPAAGSRAAYIERYAMPAVLLEPLFLSNPQQAEWLHMTGGQSSNVKNLAQAIAQGIRQSFAEGSTIGLSPGHIFKTLKSTDSGADCCKGDTEKDHVLELINLVESELQI